MDEVIRDAAGNITAYEVLWRDGNSNRIAKGNVRAPVAGTEGGKICDCSSCGGLVASMASELTRAIACVCVTTYCD